MNRQALCLIALPLICTLARAEDTVDGCDAPRWREWDSIISEAEGDPVEVADAAAMRELNRAVCSQLAAGQIDPDAAMEEYDDAIDAWIKRVRERQIARDNQSGRSEAL